jgi:hypothetical protein
VVIGAGLILAIALWGGNNVGTKWLVEFDAHGRRNSLRPRRAHSEDPFENTHQKGN